MTGFLERMFGRNRDNGTANKAKERLQLVLLHDRIQLPPERLQAMKQEIVGVISKYVHVAEGDVDIELEQRNRTNNLLRAEIPFSSIDFDDEETQGNPLVLITDETDSDADTVVNPRLQQQSEDQDADDTAAEPDAASGDDD